jgi:hypothetical protein
MCILRLFTWLLAETLKIYPFYLAYFDELVGGSGNGYLVSTDINAG